MTPEHQAPYSDNVKNTAPAFEECGFVAVQERLNSHYYHKPQLFVIGTAIKLVRGLSPGDVRDARAQWIYT